MSKLHAAIFLLFAVAASSAFAEGPSVSIRNVEGVPLYYAVDPPELARQQVGSATMAAAVSSYLAAESATFPFTKLEARAEATLAGLAQGTHTLLVLFDTGGGELPARVLSLQADSSMGARSYELYSEPALLMATSGVGKLAKLAPATSPAAETSAATTTTTPPVEAAAAQPTETQPTAAPAETGPGPVLDEIAEFAPSWDPGVFSREENGKLAVLPIAQAASWGLPGTRLSSLEGAITDDIITLLLRSPNGFSSGVSVFLYVFSERKPGVRCPLTLELRVAGDRGIAAAWQENEPQPRLVGTVAVVGKELIWSASTSDLPGTLASLAPSTTIDLATAWLDSKDALWEEFYMTTFALADLKH